MEVGGNKVIIYTQAFLNVCRFEKQNTQFNLVVDFLQLYFWKKKKKNHPPPIPQSASDFSPYSLT